MSDYCRCKVIRLKVSPAQLNVESLWDLENKFPELFKFTNGKGFEVAPTEKDFIDYLLSSTYGEENSDFGRVRKLTEKEFLKYLPLFKILYPEVTIEDLRLVDYCWYNCAEAPDYFDESTDNFYDEI